MDYQTDIVENMLRNYFSLESHPDPSFSDLFVDLANGLMALRWHNEVLYYTIVNVFISGMPIQDQAYNEGVTTRMINYRLNEALDILTKLMNGETVNEG